MANQYKDRFGYLHNIPSKPVLDINKEVDRLYKKEFPVKDTKPNVNEVKKLREFLENALDY